MTREERIRERKRVFARRKRLGLTIPKIDTAEYVNPWEQLIVSHAPTDTGLHSIDWCEAHDAASELSCGCLAVDRCECAGRVPV